MLDNLRVKVSYAGELRFNKLQVFLRWYRVGE
jgi:hypothetical protein